MTAYIISNTGEPIASIIGEAISGRCRYGFYRCKEEINANREWNIVNSRAGKVSNNKKWEEWEKRWELLPFAVELNPRQYFIEG